MDDPHKNLVKIQKLIIQLQSDNPDERFDACEQLRLLPSLPEFALNAMSKATRDPHPDVADAAQRAISHHTAAPGPSPYISAAEDTGQHSIIEGPGQFSAPSEGAGFWIRALARIIDTVFLYIVAFTVSFILGILIILVALVAGMSDSEIDVIIQSTGALSPLSYILSLVASIAYFSTLEFMHGSTLGKRICGLVVVAEDGSPCGFSSALGRDFIFLLDALFFGAVGAYSMSRPENSALGING